MAVAIVAAKFRILFRCFVIPSLFVMANNMFGVVSLPYLNVLNTFK